MRPDHLRDLLSAYRPIDAAERTHRASMLELLAMGPDALSRHHYVPGHFTASALIIDADQRELLMILHAKLGFWMQPGGHVEPGDDDILAAARREAEEEVGLAALELHRPGIFDIDVHEIPAFSAAPAHRHFDVRFLFRAAGQQPTAASDARAVRWVPLAAVHRQHTDASIMRAVTKLLDGS